MATISIVCGTTADDNRVIACYAKRYPDDTITTLVHVGTKMALELLGQIQSSESSTNAKSYADSYADPDIT